MLCSRARNVWVPAVQWESNDPIDSQRSQHWMRPMSLATAMEAVACQTPSMFLKIFCAVQICSEEHACPSLSQFDLLPELTCRAVPHTQRAC